MSNVNYQKELEIARNMVNKLYFSNFSHFFSRDEYYTLIKSKIIAYSECFIKKDSKPIADACGNKPSSILYFDDKKYLCVKDVLIKLKNMSCFNYKIDNTCSVVLTGGKNQELEEAVWFFHKMRDSIVHEASSIDFKNGIISFDNIEPGGRFSFNGQIEIDQLNDILSQMFPITISTLPFDYYRNVLYGLRENITDQKHLEVIDYLLSLYKEDKAEFNKSENLELFEKTREFYKELVVYYEKTVQMIVHLKNIISVERTVDIDLFDATLYNFLSLLFINEDRKIDYARLDTSFIKVDFTTPVRNTYLDKKDSFTNTLNKLLCKAEDLITKYDSEMDSTRVLGLKIEMINLFKKVLNEVLSSFAVLNECKITFLRNAIEHSNFHRNDNNELAFYDTPDTSTKKDRINIFVNERKLMKLSYRFDELNLENQLGFDLLLPVLESFVGIGITNRFIFFYDYVCQKVLEKEYKPKISPEFFMKQLDSKCDDIILMLKK